MIEFFREYSWALSVTLVIVSTAIIGYLEIYFYKRLAPRLEKKKKHWEYGIIHAFHKPFNALIWITGFFLLADIVSAHFGDVAILNYIPQIRKVCVVFLLVLFFIRFIKEIERILLITSNEEGRRALDITTIRAIGQVLRVIAIVTSICILMQSLFGIGASAILALAGGGSITIGWAAKDMLANFFGGLMIFLDRPFVIGDWIRSADRSLEGYVEHIGWRLTRIRTFEKVPLYIPNSIFLNITVENPSRMSNRRIKTFVGIRYCDASKMKSIVADVKQMLDNHEGIDHTKLCMVNFSDFAESSLNFMIYCFTKATRWADFQRERQDVYLKVLDIIEKHNAEVAFPTTTLHFPEGMDLLPEKS